MSALKSGKPTKRNKAIRYRAYPTREQIIFFHKTFGCCRLVWNLMLGEKIDYYDAYHKLIDITPAKYKKLPEYHFLKEVDSLALCNVQLNQRQAFKNCFESGFGFPRFKSKKRSKKSYKTNNTNNCIRVEGSFIRLPKVGKVKVKLHRLPKPGWVIKSATVTEDAVGDVWISVLFEYETSTKPISSVSDVLGLDYKSDGLAMTDGGEVLSHSKHFREAQRKLAREQRKLSRKEKGSNNYEKQRKKVARLHRYIVNQRKDDLHKLSSEIANRFDLVCVETLNMKSIGNHGFHLGKATMDNGYGMFLEMLAYKLEDRGKYLQKVDKWYPSSQICSKCGRRQKLDLSQRTYVCECGLSIDRDINAAINIKREGLRVFSEDHPSVDLSRAGTVRTQTLVEIGSTGNQSNPETSHDSSTQSVKQEARLFIAE